MARIAQLDRLLSSLRERIFVGTGTFVPLRYRPADNGDRREVVAALLELVTEKGTDSFSGR